MASSYPMRMQATRQIHRPAEEVFAVLADAGQNPRWQRGMRSCTWEDGSGPALGARYRQEASFLGRPVRTTFEVTRFEPGRRIRIESRESTFPIQVERAVEPTGPGSCRASAVVEGGPAVPRLLEPAVRWLAQRAIDGDWDRLVALLEGDGAGR